MTTNYRAALVLYVVLMVAIIVAVDILFFRHQFGRRLLANIVVVLAFVVLYFVFLKR